jgi:hypothetical protein
VLKAVSGEQALTKAPVRVEAASIRPRRVIGRLQKRGPPRVYARNGRSVHRV